MIADMPRTRKPYVQREKSRHGKVTWYFRRGDGPRIRLHGEYESAEWLADYEAALAGTKRPEPARSQAGTLRWLVGRFYESKDWSDTSAATQRQRKSIFNRMLATGGDLKLSQITKGTIVEGMDRRRETPAAAVCFAKAMRALYKWALKAEHVTEDPTVGVEAVDPKTDGHHTWTVPEVQQFQAFYPLGTRERLALDILLYTGMRASDAVLFGRQHIRDGVVEYRSLKTKVEVVIPLLPPLAESIAAAAQKTQMALLLTEFGTPFSSANSFGNWFRNRCKAAGVPGRAHGLRKAGATISAEGGASDQQLMAMYGWTQPRQAGVYTRKANRATLAREAAKRIVVDEAGTSIPAPSAPVRGSGVKD